MARPEHFVSHIFHLRIDIGEKPCAGFELFLNILAEDALILIFELMLQACPGIHGDASEFCSAETYDAVLAWDSLFHLPPERQRPMMERISALLKPGGILLMTSGMKEGYASGLMNGVMFHYSTLSQGEYRRILERNHLVILKMIQDQPPEEHLVTFARKRLF